MSKKTSAILPDVFTGEPPELNMQALALVRVTDICPQIEADGAVNISPGTADRENTFRNTLHFALNHHVEAHACSWDNKPFAIIAGFAKTHKINQDRLQSMGQIGADFEGSVLRSLNPVDTWWSVGLEGKLQLPDATIVMPDTHDGLTRLLPTDGLCKADGAITIYKADDYTCRDLETVLNNEKLRSSFVENVCAAGDMQLMRAELSRNSDLPVGDHLEHIGLKDMTGSVNSFLCQTAKKLAVNETLVARGYPVQEANKDYWLSARFGSEELKQIASAGKELGAEFEGGTYHMNTADSHFENSITMLLRKDKAERNIDAELRVEEELSNTSVSRQSRIAAMKILRQKGFDIRSVEAPNQNPPWKWRVRRSKEGAKKYDGLAEAVQIAGSAPIAKTGHRPLAHRI